MTSITTLCEQVAHDRGLLEQLVAKKSSASVVRRWPNNHIVKRNVTEGSLTVGMTPIETTAAAVELFNGAAPDQNGHVVLVVGKTGGLFAMCTDIWDGSQFVRTHYPRCEVTARGAQQITAGGNLGYPMTISAEPDPALRDDQGRIGSAERWYVPLANPAPIPDIPQVTQPQSAEQLLTDAVDVETEALAAAEEAADVVTDIAAQYPVQATRLFPVTH